jgi:peptide/nickel transport system substrate-binding protein
MKRQNRLYALDEQRKACSDAENDLIDDYLGGTVTRGQFLKHGSAIGLSIPFLSSIVAACGGSSSSGSSGGAPQSIALLRVANQVPVATPNPLTTYDNGGQPILSVSCEYLCRDNTVTRQLEPVLATSWKPNADASKWTFKIRPGVKFSNGRALSADDVVYTLKQQSDPNNGGNALTAFEGVLTPDGVTKVDDGTVQCELVAPNGTFPYQLSSDNYNCVIVPDGTDLGNAWAKTMIGTGPFLLKSYTPNTNVQFTANPHWWAGRVGPQTLTWQFFHDQQTQVLALQSGSVDVINNIVYQGAQGLFSSSQYTALHIPTSSHRQLSMRCDKPPFNDPRVRQAIALTLDRPQIAKALFGGYAQVGNDSPFAPTFPSTDPSVNRAQDLTQAKELLSAAGYANGLSTTLYAEQYQEIPAFAQIIKDSAAKIGVDIKLVVEPQAAYYGKATFGNSDWLDGEMSLVDFSNRGVPNVILQSTLTSGGPWNAAHFKNSQYDSLVKRFVAAVTLSDQRSIASQIQTLLLDQTPVVIAYFYDVLAATANNIHGVQPDGSGNMFVGKAYES